VTDALFPSGPWTGFYTYANPQDRHRTDLLLEFAGGRMTGEGNDDVGRFVILGRYDDGTRECYWTKTYVGAHSVFYWGYREGKGIWGRWEIALDTHGGFHIWPRAVAEGEERSEQSSESADADRKESRSNHGRLLPRAKEPMPVQEEFFLSP
jgi:hypothetical protein